MPNRHTAFIATLFLALAGAVAQPALAADTPPTTAAAPDKLAAARQAIQAKDWKGAIAELQRVNDSASADWHNLMGYSLRKAKTPDLDGAERHYNEALRIEPKHRGALEYSGELYLMRGDLARAEQRLAALDKACFFGCDEHKDLKAAIERYKAAGNRHVAAQQ